MCCRNKRVGLLLLSVLLSAHGKQTTVRLYRNSAALDSDPQRARAYVEFLHPEPTEEGIEPETRVVHCGMSWERYLAFDKALGDNRPGPRFYYLDEELEIMTTSKEHERIKARLAGLIAVYCEQADIEMMPHGQATMRLAPRAVGAEPDESWCFGEEKEFPDLVLEIALTSGGVKKLDLYRRFRVPEVWIWRKGKLEVFALDDNEGDYQHIPTGSRLLPGLDTALLERCVAISSWREATRAFRAGQKMPS